MRLQFGPFLVITALLSAPVAWSQAGSSDSTQTGSSSSSQTGGSDSSQTGTSSSSSQTGLSGPSQTGPAESSPQPASEGPQPVFTHPESKPQLALLDEVTQHNYINLGLGLTTAYDSNAAAFSYYPYNQTMFIASPSVQLRQTHPTFTWYLGAYGGLTTSTIPGYYNTSNPSANAGFLWQINHHWQLNVNDSYMYSFDPFQQYITLTSPPTYNQPNPTIYVPLTTTEANYGNMDLTYQITAHDSVTFTGTENFRRYLHNSYSAYNLYSWGGVGFYQHLFSPRLSAGTGYSFTSLDFGHGTSRSGISMIQAFINYQLGPHMSISGWVGPEYTSTKNLVPVFCTPYGCFIEVAHNSSWSEAFGANFSWQGARNAAVAGFYKSISDGGILLGVVQLWEFNGNFVRQMSPRWSFNVGALYGNNTGYSTLVHLRHLNSFTGNVSLTRQITPAWSGILEYLRYWETQKNIIGAAAPKWTDNRIQFTLQYYWGHSLGR